MKARFKLPMNIETAAQYLTSVISAEVEYRNHPFRNGSELHKQVASVAHWLCGMSGKNSLLLVGGCGNGKTTFVYAMQNLVNHLGIKNQATRSGLRYQPLQCQRPCQHLQNASQRLAVTHGQGHPGNR